MPDLPPPGLSLVSLLAGNHTIAGELDQLAEELATLFVEFFRAELAGDRIQQEDLPSLVDAACAELVQEFLDDARVHGGYEALGHADREEYAQLVGAKVRRAIHAALELA